MGLRKDPFNVIITGVGGQGNVLASQLLGQMLVTRGFVITIGETYGASQRGGSVMSHLRISLQEPFSPLIPEGLCDLVIGLEPIESLRVLGQYGNPEVCLLVNTRPIFPLDVISGEAEYPDVAIILETICKLSRHAWVINATDIALEMGNPVIANIVMLGALSALDVLPVGEDDFRKTAEEFFSPEQMELNLEALRRGRAGVRSRFDVNPARARQ